MKKILIFTDLDGTLLDAGTYSFEPAQNALKKIKEMDIPLIIVSSKTAKEIIHYRNILDNEYPFVSENGGGIFIPKDYFREMPFWIQLSGKYGFDMVTQGKPYKELVKALRKLRAMKFKIKGFSDLSIRDIQEITGLNEKEARFSKERDFDEPLITDDSIDMKSLKQAINSMGLRYTSGRFIHLIGRNDKGRAVRVIRDIYRRNFGTPISIAIGDNLNDIPMFLNVEYPILVKKPDGKHDEVILKEVPNIIASEGIGPEGFNQSIQRILEELHEKA